MGNFGKALPCRRRIKRGPHREPKPLILKLDVIKAAVYTDIKEAVVGQKGRCHVLSFFWWFVPYHVVKLNGVVVVAHRKTSPPTPPFCSQKIKWFKLSKPQYGRARASRITRKKMFVGKGNVRWVFIASLLRQSCVHKVDEISFVFPQDR